MWTPYISVIGTCNIPETACICTCACICTLCARKDMHIPTTRLNVTKLRYHGTFIYNLNNKTNNLCDISVQKF